MKKLLIFTMRTLEMTQQEYLFSHQALSQLL